MRPQNRYTPKQFAEMIGVSVSTLQRWDRDGILVAGRTPTNRRVYNDTHLERSVDWKSSKPDAWEKP